MYYLLMLKLHFRSFTQKFCRVLIQSNWKHRIEDLLYGTIKNRRKKLILSILPTLVTIYKDVHYVFLRNFFNSPRQSDNLIRLSITSVDLAEMRRALQLYLSREPADRSRPNCEFSSDIERQS